KDGNDRYGTEILADDVDFIAWPKREAAGSQPETDDIPF
ncbi:single-stranded DNA-binding protein, partial [Salmonella enterica subsp. enterica]|nr:single-stranded DNA-binding protein [Salmonella enterica subsp. enterica]